MFDLNNIISKYNIDTGELAAVLFPSVTFKKQALDRVLKYEATINVEQLASLANFLNVSISELFEANWNTTRTNGKLVLSKGNVTIKLFEDNYYYSVYKDNKLLVRVVDDGTRLSVEDFLNVINQINKY